VSAAPDPLAARLPALTARARILRAVREHFAAQDFLEVETPARVPAPGQEVHLDAFPAGGGRFLITSPEYHMKRLVAAGAPRIFQIGRAFRAEEQGPQHQPEFTIIEWYRAHQPLLAIAEDCEALVRAAAIAAGTFPLLPARPGQTAAARVRVDGRFEVITVAEALARHAAIDLRGDETAAVLADKARAAGIDLGGATAYDDVFFQIFLDRVEPHLGVGRPTFVFDWPLPLAALARRKPSPRHPGIEVADRFELYAGGLELANAFGELTDASEQRARFSEESALRAARGKTVYPLDEKLLAALPRMPETAGVALGFDRLVMLAIGAAEIRDVVAFADDEV
jgi:lysyl-tRNA synthetase class 2